MNLLELGIGALVGLTMALTGAGGGILAVPLLVFGLNLPVAEAAPIALVAVFASAAIGAWLGLRDGLVVRRTAVMIGGAGMAMSPIGALVAHRIPNAPLMVVFSGLLFWIGWRNLTQANRVSDKSTLEIDASFVRIIPGEELALPMGGMTPMPVFGAVRSLPVSPPQGSAGGLMGVGAAAGLLSGLLGVGGGFVVVPWLSRHTALPAHRIVATSLMIIALVSLGGVAAAVAHGGVHWAAAAPFAAGAIGAQFVGRCLAMRVAGPRLQQAFALLCGISAALLLLRGLGWLAL